MWIISLITADYGGKFKEAASLWFVLLSHQLGSKLNTNDSFIKCIQLYSCPCVFFSFTLGFILIHRDVFDRFGGHTPDR